MYAENCNPNNETMNSSGVPSSSGIPAKAGTPEQVPGGNYTEDLGGGVTLEMIWIPGGSFMMGSNDGAKVEKPVHRVALDGFWMGKFLVTQEQYERVMGDNPSRFKGPRNPVEKVSWYEATAFCLKLQEKTGMHFSLPSESQWEYACRAGNQGKWCYGNREGQLDQYAWYNQHQQFSGLTTHPVGEKKANACGLYDMHGNVWEWCQDWVHLHYTGAPEDGSAWERPEGKYRVMRGGSFKDFSFQSRSSYRGGNSPAIRYDCNGFRVSVSRTNQV